MNADVFISYSIVDREHANAIAVALQHEGLQIWWDALLRPGMAWEKQILATLKEVRLVLAVVSRESAAHPEYPTEFQRQAWQFVLENNLPIMLVFVGGDVSDALPAEFRKLPTIFLSEIDFIQGSLSARSARLLAERVLELLREAPAGPPAASDEALRQFASVAAETARQVSNAAPAGAPNESPASIFVVHGHDPEMLNAVTAELSNLNVEPVVLNRVRTSDDHLFAKFKAVAGKARHAIVLISGDDVGASYPDYFHRAAGGAPSLQFRARQNVVLELGFFYGKLSEENVFVFHKPPPSTEKMLSRFEFPSDLWGKIFEDFSGDWQDILRQRLKDAGFAIDIKARP